MASTTELVTESVQDLQAAPQNDPTKQNKTFTGKLKYIREIITVEPLIATYVMASILCLPALTSLEFDKACRSNLNQSDEICDSILAGNHDNISKINDDLQSILTNMHSWQQPMQTAVPTILILFLGSYSDRHKLRKPFFLIPLIGELVSCTLVILNVVYMREWPVEVMGACQVIIPSFMGGQPMIVMAVYAYIADVSTIEMRTLRIGVVQIVLNISVPIVQSFSGILFVYIGYINILLIAFTLYCFAFLYGWFGLKEPRTPSEMGLRSRLVDLFEPTHAIQTFTILFKKFKGNNLLLIYLLLMSLFFYSGVVVGEQSIFYLYVQRNFHWTVLDLSYFFTVNTLIHSIGTLLAVPLFTRIFHLNDIWILFLTFMDKVVTNIIFGLAKSNTMLYVAAAVSVITGVTPVAIRSIATKIVSEDHLGKMQSLVGVVEAVAPAISTPAYNKVIYDNTKSTFPATFFFVGAFLYAACCLDMRTMNVNYKKHVTSLEQEQQNVATNGNGLQMKGVDEVTHM